MSSVQKESSDRGHSNPAAGGHASPPLVTHEPLDPASATAAVISGTFAAKIAPKVINLEGSSEGGVGSPPGQDVGNPQTNMITRAPPTSSGPVRPNHLSVTTPGVQSNWHVNRQAKDLSQVYPYDVELMAKVGGVGCFEADSIMMARCLTIMQYHRRVVEEEISLHGRLTGLEQQVESLMKTKEILEQAVLDLRKVNADKESVLATKEA